MIDDEAGTLEAWDAETEAWVDITSKVTEMVGYTPPASAYPVSVVYDDVEDSFKIWHPDLEEALEVVDAVTPVSWDYTKLWGGNEGDTYGGTALDVRPGSETITQEGSRAMENDGNGLIRFPVGPSILYCGYSFDATQQNVEIQTTVSFTEDVSKWAGIVVRCVGISDFHIAMWNFNTDTLRIGQRISSGAISALANTTITETPTINTEYPLKVSITGNDLDATLTVNGTDFTVSHTINSDNNTEPAIGVMLVNHDSAKFGPIYARNL